MYGSLFKNYKLKSEISFPVILSANNDHAINWYIMYYNNEKY